jgi:hypothetical protein
MGSNPSFFREPGRRMGRVLELRKVLVPQLGHSRFLRAAARFPGRAASVRADRVAGAAAAAPLARAIMEAT